MKYGTESHQVPPSPTESQPLRIKISLEMMRLVTEIFVGHREPGGGVWGVDTPPSVLWYLSRRGSMRRLVGADEMRPSVYRLPLMDGQVKREGPNFLKIFWPAEQEEREREMWSSE